MSKNKPWSPVTSQTNSSFMDAMENILSNVSYTENGAVGYKTSGSALVDINFSVASLRGKSHKDIFTKFFVAFNENPIWAMRWLFFARDVRSGLGERNLFRSVMMNLCHNGYSSMALDLLPLIPEFGRWDDVICLLDVDTIKDEVAAFIHESLLKDIANCNDSKSISLLAKWMPSEQAHNEVTKRRAYILTKHFKWSNKKYRKTLSKLRRYLEVVETKMSSNQWEAIDYEKVPSKANLIYKNAFLKHDNYRRNLYLEAVKSGEAKINSSTAYPHDIVNKYLNNVWYSARVRPLDITLEEMWESLPNYINGNSSTIVVSDGSGSMLTSIPNSKVSAWTVANSLAIYFAQKLSGEFYNKFITFSSRPELVKLSDNSLRQNIQICLNHNDCSNTNIEAVFDLILKTAVSNKLKQEEIPANILIISDMEFDHATTTDRNYFDSLFDTIANKYTENGYDLPRLVFWNVNSRTNTIPITQNKYGVALVSGFSPSVCKMVLSGKLDPLAAILEVIMDKRYDCVEEYVRKYIK